MNTDHHMARMAPPERFVAIVNTPGYLPQDDEPATFDTPREAWQYLRDEHAMSWNDVDVPGDPDGPLPEPWRSQYQSADEELAKRVRWAESGLVCDFEAVGTVYVSTPGYDGDHDLGLAYTVALEERP